MDHPIVLKFHPWEEYFPEITDSRVECSKYKGICSFMGDNYNFTEYAFEYESNDTIGRFWCCFPNSNCLGYHKGYLEKIILLYDEDGNPKYVYFNAHGRGEGMWLPYEDCEKNDQGDLIIYVARGTHAFYPHGEIYWRVFGLANDLCSREGQSYRIHSIKTHSNPFHPPQSSIKHWERFLLPFTFNRVRNKQ